MNNSKKHLQCLILHNLVHMCNTKCICARLVWFSFSSLHSFTLHSLYCTVILDVYGKSSQKAMSLDQEALNNVTK